MWCSSLPQIFLRTLQQHKEYSSNFVQFQSMQNSRLSYTTWPVKHPRENERVKSFWCLKFGLSIWMEKVRCGDVSRFKWWNIGYEISPTTTTRLRQNSYTKLIVYSLPGNEKDYRSNYQNYKICLNMAKSISCVIAYRSCSFSSSENRLCLVVRNESFKLSILPIIPIVHYYYYLLLQKSWQIYETDSDYYQSTRLRKFLQLGFLRGETPVL